MILFVSQILAFLVIGAGAAWILWGMPRVRNPTERWWKRNLRGRLVPVSLGWALAGVTAVLWGIVIFQIAHQGVGDSQAGELLGASIVFIVGALDDGFGGEVRGLRGHLGALRGGQLTTGGLKVAAAVLAAAMTVAWTPRSSVWFNLLAVLAIAGCTNVWNGLDVMPGRALKGFLVVAVVLLIVDVRAFLLVCGGAGAVLLIPDLRERGMLGDSGANLLGFLAGAEIVGRLPEPWLPVAAAVVIGLNLLAETVTFTRTIEAIPPLRWFDRLGRLPEPTS